jgi:hypothetical protein
MTHGQLRTGRKDEHRERENLRERRVEARRLRTRRKHERRERRDDAGTFRTGGENMILGKRGFQGKKSRCTHFESVGKS